MFISLSFSISFSLSSSLSLFLSFSPASNRQSKSFSLFFPFISFPCSLQVRPDIVDVVTGLGKLKAKGLETVGITTNGITLSKQVCEYTHTHTRAYARMNARMHAHHTH